MRPSLSTSLQYVLCFTCLIQRVVSTALAVWQTVPPKDSNIYNYTTDEELRARVTTPPVVTSTAGRVVARRMLNGKEIVFRVANGKPAAAGEIPYMVAFKKLGKGTDYYTFCGGAIIGPTEVLTAANCFHKVGFWDYCCGHYGRAEDDFLRGVYAVAGSLNNVMQYHETDSETTGQWRTLGSCLYRPDFVHPKPDIAVAFLRKPFSWTNNVKPIAYASKYNDYGKFKGRKCLLSGFGKDENNQNSNVLRKAEVEMMNADTCFRMHEKYPAESFLCSSDEVSGFNQGDHGGPLVCKNTGDPQEKSSLGILVGVASFHAYRRSWSRGVLKGSVYTRVSTFTETIEDILERGSNFAVYAPAHLNSTPLLLTALLFLWMH